MGLRSRVRRLFRRGRPLHAREPFSSSWARRIGFGFATIGRNVAETARAMNVAQVFGYPNTETIRTGFEDYANLAYAGNAVVFGLIDTTVKLFRQATFKYRALQDKRIFGDASLEILERPWPGGTTADLLGRALVYARLTGDVYIVNHGDRLEMLRPDCVTIVSQVNMTADGYETRDVIGYYYCPNDDPDRHEQWYPADMVAHWAPTIDPCARFRGMSPLTPIVREINADKRMDDFRVNYFRNAATANLVLLYSNKIGGDRIKELREQIRADHAGPENAFKTLILDEGAAVESVGSNMEGSAFDALQAAGETRIASALGVPPVVAGLRQGLQSSQPGDYPAAIRLFVDVTLRDLWESLCACLQPIVADEMPAGSQLWYDTTDISALAPGESDRAATATQNASTINVLIMAGFTADSAVAAVTSGDMTKLVHTGLSSVQMQPLTGPPVAPAPTDPDPSTEDDNG